MMQSIQSARQLYDLARSRGLTFRLIGPKRILIEGPADATEELDSAIDAELGNIIAIVEELSSDSMVVCVAQALLTQPKVRSSGRREAFQPHGTRSDER
jgi:hypothetical protein